MSGDISTVLRIPRSANNPGSKAKSKESDQSILEGPTIFEDKCICCFSGVDDSV